MAARSQQEHPEEAAESEAVTGEVPVLCKYPRKKWLSSVSAEMPINELWSLVYVELCSISATAWNVVTPPPLASHDLNRQWSLELSLYQIRASSSPWFRLRRTTILRRLFCWTNSHLVHCVSCDGDWRIPDRPLRRSGDRKGITEIADKLLRTWSEFNYRLPFFGHVFCRNHLLELWPPLQNCPPHHSGIVDGCGNR